VEQEPDRQDDRPPAERRAWRGTVLTRVVTVLACLPVLFVLVAPDEIARMTPAAFLRIPLEALVFAGLLLVLRDRARRIAALAAGSVLGVLGVLKIVDLGFHEFQARPFDAVNDWSLLGPGLEFVSGPFGTAGAVVTVVLVVLLVAGLIVVMARSVLRLSRVVTGDRTRATGIIGALGVAWGVCGLLGAQIVPGLPVASGDATVLARDHVHRVWDGLHDRAKFAEEMRVDRFRGTPGADMLTGLRGKDVVIAFVESYGRDAIEDPRYARQIGAVLADGTRRLNAAGYGSRSGFLTSSTAGGGSWLAHASLLSGLWVDNSRRYSDLLDSDRFTLNRAFSRADWRTVAVMPGITRAWPEGRFYGFDKIYASGDLGYRGPRFSFATMPDQYTLAAFERLERDRRGRAPVMATIPLVSSHAPWASVPSLVDWNRVGDGSIFNGMGKGYDAAWPGPGAMRGEYRKSVEYTLNTLITYVERHGDENLVLVFLGDHEPAPLITGPGAGRDVPITIVARDRAVLDRVSSWGWHNGLEPGPDAPVWRMDQFRDRFLTTFGSRPR
jgi:hypothetical protein